MSDDKEPIEVDEDLSNSRLRQQLIQELDRLIERVRALAPGYTPPPFSPQRLLELMGRNIRRLSPDLSQAILMKLRSGIGEDLFDVVTWKGVWYMLNYSMEYQTDLLKRRLSGEYETDEWGFDPEFQQAVMPFFNFLYKTYWRVQTSGMEHIPEEARALLVCNHSGQIPWDAAMLATAIYNEHPSQRVTRGLFATWFPKVPFVSVLLIKMGQVLANEENGKRLLEQEQLVSVFPEGYKGIGKLFKERYRLARFGRGGFVQMALRTRSPMIPVAIVGAEETYISLADWKVVANLIDFPFFPITPTWPWLGPLGLIPLPTKWYIDIGEPIPTDHYEPGAENDQLLTGQLTDEVRNIIQEMILARLTERRSIFLG